MNFHHYQVHDHYDIWGNPEDGYSVNNSSDGGELVLPETASDNDILRALYEKGLITKIGEFADWRIDGDDLCVTIDGPSSDDPNYLIPYFTLYRLDYDH